MYTSTLLIKSNTHLIPEFCIPPAKGQLWEWSTIGNCVEITGLCSRLAPLLTKGHKRLSIYKCICFDQRCRWRIKQLDVGVSPPALSFTLITGRSQFSRASWLASGCTKKSTNIISLPHVTEHIVNFGPVMSKSPPCIRTGELKNVLGRIILSDCGSKYIIPYDTSYVYI